MNSSPNLASPGPNSPQRSWSLIVTAVILLACLGLQASAVGTAFTYQGSLQEEGAPVDGILDFRLILYDAEVGGSQIGNVLTNLAVEVQNGLVNLLLDFGAEPFLGDEVWLEIALRPGATMDSFIPLHPRQSFRPAPHAIHAQTANNAVTATTATTATTADSATSAAQVSWSGIIDMPPDFADGIDRDTTYEAGRGLELVDEVFHLRFDGTGAAETAARSDHVHPPGDAATLGGMPPAEFAAALHAHSFDQILGSVADEQLGPNLARLDADQAFLGFNWFAGTSVLTNNANLFHGSFSGDASGLLNLAGTALLPGSVGVDALAPGAITSSQVASDTLVPANLNLPAFSATFWSTGGNPGDAGQLPFLGTTDMQPLELGANRTRALRLVPNSTNSVNLIAGSSANDIDDFTIGATIAGGGAATHGGFPHANQVYGDFGTIGGGSRNRVDVTADWSTIAGGLHHTIELNTQWGTISGGRHNSIGIDADFSAIGGGATNAVLSRAEAATVSGGASNTIGTDAHFASIPGGRLNRAEGRLSLAAGHQAHALHEGSLVWADSHPQPMASTDTNQVTFRATGGIRFFTDTDLNIGVLLEPGSGTWLTLSDRNAKTNFEPVDPRSLLDQLDRLPIHYWSYRSQNPAARHIGPVAQDFHAAFDLGSDPRRLATVDVDGVALAAIQGLNRKLREELESRDRELQELRDAVATLQSQVLALTTDARPGEQNRGTLMTNP
jgi:trimeric autotransporter adhesin